MSRITNKKIYAKPIANKNTANDGKNEEMVEVYASLVCNMTTMTQNIIFTIEYSNPLYSTVDTKPIPVRRIEKNSTCLNFFMDMVGDFGVDEVTVIRERTKDVIKNKANMILLNENRSVRDVYLALYEFIEANKELKKITAITNAYVKDGCGYIRTTFMDDFMQLYGRTLGYKRLEILKMLKLHGFLRCSDSRNYDVQVNIDNNRIYFYVIKFQNEFVPKKE